MKRTKTAAAGLGPMHRTLQIGEAGPRVEDEMRKPAMRAAPRLPLRPAGAGSASVGCLPLLSPLPRTAALLLLDNPRHLVMLGS